MASNDKSSSLYDRLVERCLKSPDGSVVFRPSDSLNKSTLIVPHEGQVLIVRVTSVHVNMPVKRTAYDSNGDAAAHVTSYPSVTLTGDVEGYGSAGEISEAMLEVGTTPIKAPKPTRRRILFDD